MGKRVIRLFPPDLTRRLDDFNGRELSVILHSGVVLHGTLLNRDDHSLYLKDFLRQRHPIPFAAVAEVNVDHESPY